MNEGFELINKVVSDIKNEISNIIKEEDSMFDISEITVNSIEKTLSFLSMPNLTQIVFDIDPDERLIIDGRSIDTTTLRSHIISMAYVYVLTAVYLDESITKLQKYSDLKITKEILEEVNLIFDDI